MFMCLFIIFIADRHRFGEYVFAKTNTQATIEKLSDDVFCLWPVLYTILSKYKIGFSQNFLLILGR
jgi:hypothetical protein